MSVQGYGRAIILPSVFLLFAFITEGYSSPNPPPESIPETNQQNSCSKRWIYIDKILKTLARTETIYGQSLALLLDYKIDKKTWMESTLESDVIGKTSQETLQQSIPILRKALINSHQLQIEFKSILNQNQPPSENLEAFGQYLLNTLSTNYFQLPIKELFALLPELRRVTSKIENRKKGKAIWSRYQQEFNRDLAQAGYLYSISDLGLLLEMPIHRLYAYEYAVKQLIDFNRFSDSDHSLKELLETIEGFAYPDRIKLQSNEKWMRDLPKVYNIHETEEAFIRSIERIELIELMRQFEAQEWLKGCKK